MTSFIKYLTISILLCALATNGLAQKGKKDSKDKKDYPFKEKVWKLSNYSISEYSLDRDTSLHLFQVYDYNDKNSISVSNLGNMGSPYVSNLFDDRWLNGRSQVFFFDRMADFIAKPEDTKFYQVNHPYTWLYYACTPKSRNGQVIDFTHTQNANKYLNWGFNIGLVGSTGRYSHQHAKAANLTPQISWVGKHLHLHFFYKFNKMSVEENGGIVDSVEIKNNRFTTRLKTPESDWGHRSWNLVGEYSLGHTDYNIINDSTRIETYVPRIAFGYAFQYEKMFRTYEDESPDSLFYEDFHRNRSSTFDSVYYHKLSNRFSLKICENQYLPEIKGAIGAENELYFNFKDYFSPQSKYKTLNTYIEGSISKNKSKNLILSANARQYLTGYRQNDIAVKGNLGFKIFKGESDTVNYQIKASVDFLNEEPTYFEQKYYSNHYVWNNSFGKTQTIRIGGQIDIPKWHLRIGAASYLIRNFIYFNENAVPQQMGGQITVNSISAAKDFYVWKLRFANRATLQASNELERLHMPKFALYHATYLEFFLVKNVLLTQIGAEVRYSGEFDALGYAPSTSVFYPTTRTRDGKQITAGNYPLLNGFANIKIKGVLMFFKWEHIDGGMMRDWYAGTDCYPLQDFHFMFGILWRFGD